MKQREIITKLIKDDLTNNQLIDGLNTMGLEADHYHLYLSEIIFDMVGFTIDNTNFDRVYSHYDKLTKSAHTIDLKKRDGAMDKLAGKVHDELCELRDLIESERGMSGLLSKIN